MAQNVKTRLDVNKIKIKGSGQNILDLIYPIGAFYATTKTDSPADLFGGTGTQIENYFMYFSDSAGITGGSSTGNIPSHTHTIYQPAHSHSLGMPSGYNPVIANGTLSETMQDNLETTNSKYIEVGDTNIRGSGTTNVGSRNGGTNYTEYQGVATENNNLPPYQNYRGGFRVA